MIIKENINKEDVIAITLKVMEINGSLQKRLKQRNITYSVFLILGLALFLTGLAIIRITSFHDIMGMTLFILGLMYIAASAVELVFSKKIDQRRLVKHFYKNLKNKEEKFHISFDNVETITEINGEYVDSTSLGTTTRYLKKDYMNNFEDEKFYILEFSNGRYLFFFKNTFENKEAFMQLVKEIENV